MPTVLLVCELVSTMGAGLLLPRVDKWKAALLPASYAPELESRDHPVFAFLA
jgi:hypothetical protein